MSWPRHVALPLREEGKPDLVLVEGYKRESFPRIELHRVALGKPLIYPKDPQVIAIAADAPMDTGLDGPPWLDLNEPKAIAAFILERLSLTEEAS